MHRLEVVHVRTYTDAHIYHLPIYPHPLAHVHIMHAHSIIHLPYPTLTILRVCVHSVSIHARTWTGRTKLALHARESEGTNRLDTQATRNPRGTGVTREQHQQKQQKTQH